MCHYRQYFGLLWYYICTMIRDCNLMSIPIVKSFYQSWSSRILSPHGYIGTYNNIWCSAWLMYFIMTTNLCKKVPFTSYDSLNNVQRSQWSTSINIKIGVMYIPDGCSRTVRTCEWEQEHIPLQVAEWFMTHFFFDIKHVYNNLIDTFEY
jgi:hypothetical protein